MKKSRSIYTAISAIFFTFIIVFSFTSASLAASDLKVGICADLPPYNYLDGQGNPAGMNKEIMDIIASRQGYSVDYIVCERASDAIAALQNHDVDIVIGVFPSDIPQESDFQFSNTISSASVCMMVNNNNLEDILYSVDGGYRYGIAFELGTISYTQLSNFPVIHLTAYATQSQVYDALKSNRVEAAVGIKDSLNYALERDGIRDSFTMVSSNIEYVEYKLLVRGSDRALLREVNDRIGKLWNDGEYNAIINKWVVDPDKERMQGRIQNLLWIIACVIGIASIVILMFYYFNSKILNKFSPRYKTISARF